MAGRYHDRPFAAGDDEDPRGSRRPGARDESDPLSELARLIGQTDPFEEFGRANRPAQQAGPGARHPAAPGRDDIPRAAPIGSEPPLPSWLTSAHRNQQDYGAPGEDGYRDDPGVHAEAYRPHGSLEESYPETNYRRGPATDFGQGGGADYRGARAYESDADDYSGHGREARGAPGASPYDDVLYGTPPGEPAPPRGGYRDSGRYADDEADPYGDSRYDAREDEGGRSRRGKMLAVVGVLMLAVVGTAGAYGYRHYVAAPRGGEPPVIKADNVPTKVVPASAPTGEGSSKPIQDRVGGNAPERVVSREEQPVDVNQMARPEPRVVFPPLNQPNTNPPPQVERQTAAPPAFQSAPAGKTAADQPKRVRTVAIRGNEQGQAPAVQAPIPPPPAAQAAPPPAPRASAPPRAAPLDDAEPQGNAPMQLSPQRQQTSARAQQQTAAATTASAGGYVVQVSSQRSEQDAQASYRALQGKFPSVLGSRSATIKRVDLGDKGVYFRAVIGPFSGSDEASRFCSDLKSAGGQCVVQRN